MLALLAWKLLQKFITQHSEQADELLGIASSILLDLHFNVGIILMYIVFIFTLPSRVQFMHRQSFKWSVQTTRTLGHRVIYHKVFGQTHLFNESVIHCIV